MRLDYMARELEGLADVVVMTVKSAMTPLLERLSGAETRLAQLDGVRDRLVTVETKCGAMVAAPPDATASEQRLLAAMDRLSALEYAIQRAESHETTIAELKTRLAAAEATASQYAEMAATARQLIERVAVIEAKSAVPSVAAPLIDSLSTRVQTLEHRVIEDPAMKECAAIRERIAVVESRAPVPGPSGPAGKDGADGLGFDDLSVEFDGDRTLALKFQRGTQVKTWPITLPVMRYQGVYQEGKTYDVGDTVTWGGAMHYCKEATITKPGESKAWQLCVKQGRDGRDGKFSDPATAPIVSVRP